jgi:hypothetical protein
MSRAWTAVFITLLEARIAFVEKSPLSDLCTILNKFGYQFFEFDVFNPHIFLFRRLIRSSSLIGKFWNPFHRGHSVFADSVNTLSWIPVV